MALADRLRGIGYRLAALAVACLCLTHPDAGAAQTAPPVDPAPAETMSTPADSVATGGNASTLSAPPQTELPPLSADQGVSAAWDRGERYLRDGGPAIAAIALLSLVTVALIIWKLWRFSLAGAWSRRPSRRAVELWEAGQTEDALALVEKRRGLRSRMVAGALRARTTLADQAAREETTRIAKHLLAGQTPGLRALELISTIAPLLGLLGTVLGMIAAFQALQEAGSGADPALLAGGIWEALLTTAAGMAVAIPASAALTWFEAVIDNVRQDMEDMAARIFVVPWPGQSDTDTAALAAQ